MPAPLLCVILACDDFVPCLCIVLVNQLYEISVAQNILIHILIFNRFVVYLIDPVMNPVIYTVIGRENTVTIGLTVLPLLDHVLMVMFGYSEVLAVVTLLESETRACAVLLVKLPSASFRATGFQTGSNA